MPTLKINTQYVNPTNLFASALDRSAPEDMLEELVMTPPELLYREEALIVAARRAGLEARSIGTFPIFSGYRYYCGNPHDWVLLNLADDPLMSDPDGYPIPKTILRRLACLNRTDAPVDILAVAHEVPKGRLHPGESISLELIAPPYSAVACSLARQIGTCAHWFWKTAMLPLGLTAALGAGIATAASRASGAGAALALDPIIIGGVVTPGRPACPGEPARWVYLAHWIYNGKE